MRTTLSLLLIMLGIAHTTVQAQLPPFRFLGAPVSTVDPEIVLLMNDRILVGDHIYEQTSRAWKKLESLSSFYLEKRGRALPDRVDFNVHVLNDSLIAFDSAWTLDNQVFYIWNVNSDALVHTGAVPKAYSEYHHHFFVDGGQRVVYYNLDTLSDRITYTVYPFGSTVPTDTMTMTFTVNAVIDRIMARANGGYWIADRSSVSYSDDLTSASLLPSPGYQPMHWRLAADGSTLVLLAKDAATNQHYVCLLSSPTSEWVRFPIPNTYTNDFNALSIDAQGRYWFYEHHAVAADSGRGDGYVAYDTSGVASVAGFPLRTRVFDVAISSSGLIAANTAAGIQISEDGGATWEITTPPNVLDTLSGTIAISRDGTVYLLAPNGPCYVLSEGGTQFNAIPGEYFPKPSSDQFPMPTRRVPSIYERQDAFSVCMFQGRWYFGDDRGLVGLNEISSGKAEGIWFNDSLYMWGQWYVGGNSSTLALRRWIPGELSKSFSFDPTQPMLTAPITLSNGAVFLGGDNGRTFITQTGLWANITTLEIDSPTGYEEGRAIYSFELRDSLFVIVQVFGKQTGLFACPIDQLASLRHVRSLRLESPYSSLIRGHGTTYLDVFEDSVVVHNLDVSTSTRHPLIGIEEKSVIDLAYNPIERVYYATTNRGLYRSDPVVSSVASDVLRPTSGLPLQTTWYNTLGEQISPPTLPGLYFKIMLTDAGSMVSEKVLIR